MENALYDELLVELECPVCSSYMVPPIRQCSTGHSVCQHCRQKLPKCPLCQSKFTDAKNLSLEALARKMHYPCINKTSGCMARLILDEIDRHERICKYKGFKCAMERCPWVGRLEDVVAHWNSKKITSKPYQANNVCHTKVKPVSFYTNIVKAHNQLFWFKCKTDCGNIFWSVQFIGKAEDAKNYYYEIDIFNSILPKRKIILSDYCQAADIDNSELFQPGICCYATVNSLNQYMGEDQLLIYYMRVNTVDKNANVHKQYIKPKEEEPSPSHVKHKKKAKKLEQD